MKLSFTRLSYLFVLTCLPFGLSAQKVYTGAQAYQKYRGAEVVRDSKYSNLPSYIKFRKTNQIDIDELKSWMISNIKFDPNMGFLLLREEPDNLGHVHYRYQQTYQDKPIEDAIWIVHTNNDKVYSQNGLIYANISSTTSASLTEEAALEMAKEHIGATTYKWELPGEEQHLKWETEDEDATYLPEGELVYIAPIGNYVADEYRLAYKFNVYAHEPVSRSEIYVDANSGEILRENEIIHHVDEPGTAHTVYSGEREIIADSFDGEYRLRDGSRGDGVRTFDMNEGTSYGGAVDFIDDDNDWDNVNPEQDEYATDAHWGAEMTYDYYFDIHGRNSIDATGFQLNSYVHYSSDFVNAFWDGSRMTYGDGSGAVTPLTSIDIAGHEVTHGLTNFTANLIYADESGALNESFSDIFGTAIERFARPGDWNWLVGDEIGLTLRSMSNPNAFGDPDTYFGDFWAPLGGGDSGGVHTNSGVQNFWYYLLVSGGIGTNDNGDDYDVDAIGVEAADAIAFRNLTVYLTPSSEFAEARFFAIESAIDIYGVCTDEVQQTGNAWYAVGVGEPYTAVTNADFFTADTVGCTVPFTVNFVNESSNGITFEWDFGDGSTSTEENPSHTYTEAGVYTVTLSAEGGDCGSDDIVLTDYITVNPDLDCIVILPSEGTHSTQTGCEGTVFDSGGPDSEYGAGEDAIVTIAPYGALSVDLTFPFFDVEAGPGTTCDYDYLEVYDGPDASSPLIDRYCNNNLPTDISSTGSAITILFHSDGGLEEPGFEIEWSCNLPTEVPEAAFTANSTISCTGEVHFTDLSTNAPTVWEWDFGDGEGSTEQNPTHYYDSEGTYTVVLTATNLIGGDTHTEVSYVTVEYPEAPTAEGDSNCPGESATLTGSGTGTLRWYDSAEGGVPIGSGESFTTPGLDETTIFYVEDDLFDSPEFVGPADNTFGGGGFFNGDQHLIFNNPTPVILKSVDVIANGDGIRIIELRNSAGEILESLNVFIPDGESTVILDLDLPIGTNFQLGTAVGSSPDMFRNNSGGPAYPYTLAESVEITNSSAGEDFYYFFYNWEIHTHTCVSERVPVTAEVEEESDITINEIQDLCIQSGPVTLTATEGGGTWSATCATCIDNETGEFDPSVSGPGTWEITYDVPGTCSYINTQTVNVIDCLGLNDENIGNVNIYPNPTNGLITINIGNIDQGIIEVKDVLGRSIVQVPFNSNQLTVDLSDFQARGTYFVEFKDENGNLMTVKRVVKQ